VPGILVPAEAIVGALRKVAGDNVADRVKWQFDPAIDRIVATWASNFAPKLGYALGMASDTDFESIVRAYIADDLPKQWASLRFGRSAAPSGKAHSEQGEQRRETRDEPWRVDWHDQRA